MTAFSRWATPLAWTIGTVAVSWAIGHLLGAAVMARASWWRGRQPAVETAARIFRKRLPWWSLLIGAWLSTGYWPLTAEGHLLVERVLFVLGTVSVTLAAAAMASQ